MSYLVLARKWRPQVFEDVVGQEHVTRTLQNAIKTGRVAHAYLFTGARGVGKTSAARILAKALNCINGPTPVPCNICESCKEIAGGSSMDVFEIDGASNTGVDDIRELRENIKFPPIKGRYRIYIIDEVHMLSTNAFNALLKTLEEPPPHVIFVFATTDPQKIPVTILSRCQEFDFKRIPALLIQERLKEIAESEKIKITDRGLHIIAREADGGMRDAQSILDQVISFAGEDVSDEDVAKSLGVIDREVLKNVVKSIMERTPAGSIKVVERVYDYGYDVRLFCKNLLEYIRNLTVLKVIKDPGQLIDLPDGEIAELKTLSDGFSQDELQQLFAILSRGEEELKRSSSPRLSLEMTLIKMATLRPLIPVSELLERVKGLEEGLGVRGLGKKEVEKMRSLEAEKKISTSQPLNLSASVSEEKVEAHIELEEPGDTWKSFMQLVRKKRPPLASKLEHGRLIELSDTEVRVGFDKGIYLDMISKEDIKALEEMLNGYLSRSMKVAIVPLVKESKAHEPVKKEQPRQPIIEEALKVFGGRIVAESMASK
ncbi:MAG: DNA polymerase III subunit gamma/tau [Deltaproteobacteria bacterium]